jgi:hypothetical protein
MDKQTNKHKLLLNDLLPMQRVGGICAEKIKQERRRRGEVVPNVQIQVLGGLGPSIQVSLGNLNTWSWN